MSHKCDVALATSEQSAVSLIPFIDNLEVKPDVITGGEYVIFTWTQVDWDWNSSVAIQEFEAAMEKLDCYEFMRHSEDEEVRKCGNDAPGFLFASLCYRDMYGNHVLCHDDSNCNNQSENSEAINDKR